MFPVRGREEEIERTEYFRDVFRVDYEYFDVENNYSMYWSLKEKGFLPSLVKVTVSSEKQETASISVELYNGRKYERGVSIND